MRPGCGLANAKKNNILKTPFFTSLRYNLYATGGHSGIICNATGRQTHSIFAASSRYSAKPPFFKSMLPEQLFE
jgi:hypothetical protein